MHYQLWALTTGNLIREYDTEADALAEVGELLALGWTTDELGLRAEHDDGEDGEDDLGPALSGAMLADRIQAEGCLALPDGRGASRAI